MKKLLAILLVLSIVFAFGACAGKSGTETPTDAPKPANTATGKVYYLNFKPEADQAWQDLAKTYTEQTGVEVKVVTAASGEYDNTLTAEMDKDAAPTMFQIGNKGAVETWGGMITGYFPHWFLESLVPFGAKEASAHYRENELRFDANFIGAAIAPRGLILVEGLDDTWANPFGTAASWSATSEVYHFLKADEKCAIHFREGGHDLNQEDWQVLLDFVSVQLEGAKKQSNYKTYTPADPMVGRNWKAPVEEEKKPAAEGFTPEQIASLKAMLSNRWAFGDAGLETGMHRFIKAMIAKAEEQQS